MICTVQVLFARRCHCGCRHADACRACGRRNSYSGRAVTRSSRHIRQERRGHSQQHHRRRSSHPLDQGHDRPEPTDRPGRARQADRQRCQGAAGCRRATYEAYMRLSRTVTFVSNIAIVASLTSPLGNSRRSSQLDTNSLLCSQCGGLDRSNVITTGSPEPPMRLGFC